MLISITHRLFRDKTSLANLRSPTKTSWDKRRKFFFKGSPALHRSPMMTSGLLDDPTHENRMSFDDLEQVYKNISRRNILNKVNKD